MLLCPAEYVTSLKKMQSSKNDRVEVTTTAILIGGGHFAGHLGYRMSDKTRIRT